MSEPTTASPGSDGQAASTEDMGLLLEHLQKEEDAAAESTLSSMESLQMWILGHPGLQQPGIYEMINQYGPALLQMLRRLIGL